MFTLWFSLKIKFLLVVRFPLGTVCLLQSLIQFNEICILRAFFLLTLKSEDALGMKHFMELNGCK